MNPDIRLPDALQAKVDAYRQQCGERLGIATISNRCAIENLISLGLTAAAATQAEMPTATRPSTAWRPTDRLLKTDPGCSHPPVRLLRSVAQACDTPRPVMTRS